MREAIGGSWLFWMFCIFLFIFAGLTASIMNYTSAYKTNNYIISQIEEQKGNVDITLLKQTVKEKYGYTSDIDFCCSKNVTGGVIYRIKTNVIFDVPFVGDFAPIQVKTDSKTIDNGICESFERCSNK